MENRAHHLVKILRLAYSGEMAAAYAYRGHWGSVADPTVRAEIRRIEEEEWHHRRLLGELLAKLGKPPARWREIKAFLIGRSLGLLCYVSGWLLPMYAAGQLESHNIREYESAARLAVAAGHSEFADCLLEMAEIEWEHESYFRACVLNHRWGARLHLWATPPPREEIRRSFAQEVAALESTSS